VVIMPNQDLDSAFVDDGERIDIWHTANAIVDELVERQRAATCHRHTPTGQATQELERVQYGQVNAIRGERAVAGEIGSAGEGKRPSQHPTQVDTHLCRELE